MTVERTPQQGAATPGTAPKVVAEHLSKQVRSGAAALTILDDVSMQVAEGESLAIVGTSGAGKSTLLGLLAGLDAPTTGRVLLDGQDLAGLDEDARAKARAGRVGFVFQSFQLLPGLTAIENVMLPLELAGERDARQRAAEALQAVGLGERLTHAPNQLSGGEQQRVAIARAFSPGPSVLFADEPTGNLDTQTGNVVADLLFSLNAERGTTLVMVTHDERLAARCDRTLRMAGGKLGNG